MRVWIKIIINDFQNSVNMNDTLSDNLTNEARWYSTNLINIKKNNKTFKSPSRVFKSISLM